MEPKLEHIEKIDYFCNSHRINNRVFNLPIHLQSIREETQLRMEMTDIRPIGIVILNSFSNDFYTHKQFMTQDLIKRLYENANTTYMTMNDSGIHHTRFEDNDESYEDLNGYEETSRARNFSKNSNMKGRH